jgi:hypothetical protein
MKKEQALANEQRQLDLIGGSVPQSEKDLIAAMMLSAPQSSESSNIISETVRKGDEQKLMAA